MTKNKKIKNKVISPGQFKFGFSKVRGEGFTLIEIMLAIGVLAILSGAVLVSVSGQRDKARVNRMFSEMSAVVPLIYMCAADEGELSGETGVINGGTNICNLGSAYGQWPVGQEGFALYSRTGNIESNNWFFSIKQTSSGIYICCSAGETGCKTGTTATCN